MEQTTTLTDFAKDVREGLSAQEKHLSSKYFYNERGSKIFQDIMQMPEYYLTDCELEIFNTQKQEIFEAFAEQDHHFALVELGAGDGVKTKILLSHFLSKKVHFEYIPIDISGEAVKQLVNDLKQELPNLDVHGKIGDYHHILEEINAFDHTKKVLLFLGSNIGNFNEQQALDLLRSFKSVMHPGDLLFIGLDLKKDPELILKAYDDPHGHTTAFNLNLLQRINDELGGNFNLQSFKHREEYDPKSGTAKSFLVSQKTQEVKLTEINETIAFDQGECIFMEISQKYDMDMINNLAINSGFEVVRNFYDKRQYFANSMWKLDT
jgi:dimethylhistidine N-methyltransferase